MSKMNVMIRAVRGPRGVRFTVLVDGSPLRTEFAKTRSFGTESAARKEIDRLLGDDVTISVSHG
jgi:hypothetical protein